MDLVDHLLAGAAACAAGGVNAIAGGGTLISFPVLTALGLPPVSANVTNTVALSPGYLGGAWAQRSALADQRSRVTRLIVAAAAGGLVGAVLLVSTSNDTFKKLIPLLLFAASLLLITQDRIRTALRLGQRSDSASGAGTTDPVWLPLPVAVMAVYGGYFGAGLGIMLLAAMGTVIAEPLPRLNALKQVLSFVINLAAALFFLGSGKVYWSLAGVMAVTSLLGGILGGRLAGKVKPKQLRVVVVTIGFAAAVIYAIRYWF